MKTALLYPPFMDPRAPQLALPSLATHLRPNGVTVSMRDHRQAATLPRALIDIATAPRERSVRQLLSDLGEPDPEAAFALLDQLVSAGLLQLRAESSSALPGRRRGAVA